jgi:hypothetical protein
LQFLALAGVGMINLLLFLIVGVFVCQPNGLLGADYCETWSMKFALIFCDAVRAA